jgi:general secretion pathway protein A
MYKSYFKLKRNPFEITPDPAFLFPTLKHNEALASLYYAIRQRKGFVVLSGEVGTGKTLLVRCLLDYFKANEIAYAYVFDSCLSTLEFLQFIATDFGLDSSGKNKSELLHLLGGYLIHRHQQKLATVLVVDEAHLLSSEVLEEIRLLTNLETSREKLLQIVLAGQPELDLKLDSFPLRQLKQRIAIRAHLGPLEEQETVGYIRKRLELAGANLHATTLFPAETLAKVHSCSGGIPRLINTLCENGLISTYVDKNDHVSPETIESAAADLRLNVISLPPPDSIATRSMDNELHQAASVLLQLTEKLKEQRPPIEDRGTVHEPIV